MSNPLTEENKISDSNNNNTSLEELKAEEKLEGLTLFHNVLSIKEQEDILNFIENQLQDGRDGKLGKTFKPICDVFNARKQSREMLQYGAFTHTNTLQDATKLLPLSTELCSIVENLVKKGILNEIEVPDSCTINVYDVGNWLPPHIDNIHFERPFVTISLLSEQFTMFGPEITGEKGDFHGGLKFSMPIGSCLRVTGYAGDVCKHAVLPMTERRISLTFRRVTEEKRNQFKNLPDRPVYNFNK